MIDFRAFNGESYSTDLASADTAVNRPPSVTRVSTNNTAVAIEAGKPLTLSFSVSDEESDSLTVLHRLDDDTT
jgi:hypothetical protein